MILILLLIIIITALCCVRKTKKKVEIEELSDCSDSKHYYEIVDGLYDVIRDNYIPGFQADNFVALASSHENDTVDGQIRIFDISHQYGPINTAQVIYNHESSLFYDHIMSGMNDNQTLILDTLQASLENGVIYEETPSYSAYEKAPDRHIVHLSSNSAVNTEICEGFQTQEHVPSIIPPTSGHYERAQIYAKVPNVDIFQLLSVAASIYERPRFYERVPNVDIACLLSNASPASFIPPLLGTSDLYKRTHTYAKVPNVDILQLLSVAASVYEMPQFYERVPNVDIACLLSNASPASFIPPLLGTSDLYKRTHTYAKVPNVDILQLLSGAASVYEMPQLYERVPNVDIACLLSNASPEDMYERAQTYEQVPSVDIIQLLAGCTKTASEEISQEGNDNINSIPVLLSMDELK